MQFSRSEAAVLGRRLRATRRFIQAVAGPRQVGKTTLVRQVIEAEHLEARFASAAESTQRGGDWIEKEWGAARLEAGAASGGTGAGNGAGAGTVLVLDDIQELPNWSATVQRLWDQDTHSRVGLKVVLVGSAPARISQDLTEGLAGRFELLRLPHWSYPEMQAAFDWSLQEYVFYGGYPGSAALIRNERRWKRYILDSVIETTLARDVLLLSRVDKSAMLRRFFELACRSSGQILSYTGMLGQLQDVGNTTTLAHYLDLLSAAGMLAGLQKFTAEKVRRRGSSPKLQVLNTALTTAQSGYTLKEARADPEYWGRLVESSIGAHLANAATSGKCEVFYWRDRGLEVDVIVRSGQASTAIEVKSGRTPNARSGLAAFAGAFKPQRQLRVGGDGVTLESFLSRAGDFWVKR